MLIIPMCADEGAGSSPKAHRSPTFDASRDANRLDALGEWKNTAEQIRCFCEDMELVAGRTNLLRLRVEQEPARTLYGLLHESKATREAIREWADGQHLRIDWAAERSGFQILWLQGGDVAIKDGSVLACVFLPRPRRRDVQPGEALEEEPPAEEPAAEGIIKQSIAPGHFVQSPFRCRMGDIVVFKGEAKIRPKIEGTDHGSLCMFATLLSMERPKHTTIV